ncbi:DUF5133 domain-containing protein [Streptomyces sp. NPDC003077]|uniref:DUF5133 domain-containing protein n=1 Tax=Streptomyces sp. NPDC003077 TaxID=3154443 RepID=UPI0033B81E7E
MLSPDKNVVRDLISTHRELREHVRSHPGDTDRRRRLEDSSYTLCVIMGERSVGDAMDAAERHVHQPEGGLTAPPAQGGRTAKAQPN